MLKQIATTIVALAVLQPPAGDLAAKMTGRWKLNTYLSDPETGRGGRRGGAFALAPGLSQRGGRNAGAGIAPEPAPNMPGVTPAEGAAQNALRTIQQVPPEMTIDATATAITFVEPRGDSVFQVDGKSTSIEVPGSTIKVKSRWDRAGLRQEFSSTQRVLHRTWSVDGTGRLLMLKQRLEGIGLAGKESQSVFDRQ